MNESLNPCGSENKGHLLRPGGTSGILGWLTIYVEMFESIPPVSWAPREVSTQLSFMWGHAHEGWQPVLRVLTLY